jgi:hypothetical protein
MKATPGRAGPIFPMILEGLFGGVVPTVAFTLGEIRPVFPSWCGDHRRVKDFLSHKKRERRQLEDSYPLSLF